MTYLRMRMRIQRFCCSVFIKRYKNRGISDFRSMWADEFLPSIIVSSIKREIGDRAVRNQVSSRC